MTAPKKQSSGEGLTIRPWLHLISEAKLHCTCSRIEEGVHLCRSESTVFPKAVVIADLLVVSPPLLKETRFHAARYAADARPHLFWGVKQIDVSTILFAVEFKRNVASTNRNQLIMDLSAAQYHRRALGLKQKVLFGATSVNGSLKFYASQWAPIRARKAKSKTEALCGAFRVYADRC
ncbi:hypothetical protein FRB95_012292 [Tulasnella sp. JGI-2019a]|nr:hypothetical protein FRB95_012292 [Tulasnella sp. JGI-2019a]